MTEPELREMREDIIKTKAIVARQSWSLEKLKLYCKNRDKFILTLLTQSKVSPTAHVKNLLCVCVRVRVRVRVCE